jgi:hypothetical protein
MLSASLLRRVPAVAAAAVKPLGPSSLASVSLSPLSAATTWNVLDSPLALQQNHQVRWVTKKRQHRMVKRQLKEENAAKGIFPPKPHMYIPKDAPVINGVSKQERDAESRRQDEVASLELKAKMELVQGNLLRFGFNDNELVMSDRVRKLFDLNNGNQEEVVKAQKQKGMELFQLREGDTGSSSVQGALYRRSWSEVSFDSSHFLVGIY